MDILAEKSILVVDDEPDILETIEDLLASSKIMTAKSSDEASELIANRNFDLAILDIMGVNGFGLLEMCVEKHIPATMLTAYAVNKESLDKAVKLGAISFLPKEELYQLPELIAEMFEGLAKGRTHWQKLFERLETFFEKKLGISYEKEKSQFPHNYY
jgi:DNA-binding NtrC family response regulator